MLGTHGHLHDGGRHGGRCQALISLQVTVAPDAPAWAQAFFVAAGGGELATPGIDADNDYNTVENGGVFAQPTYVTRTSM